MEPGHMGLYRSGATAGLRAAAYQGLDQTPRRVCEAEPLSRGGSSDGSSVASPMAGNYLYEYDSPETHYRQLLSATTEVFLGGDDDGQSKQQQQRDFPVCCLHPGCTARPFKRRADLDRHYKHRHAPDSVKDSFSCDYPRCSRHQDPFHRLDHFRDHLREFHKEDIEKRGGSEAGLRPASSSWWRCRRCLKRVYDGHTTCPKCKTPSMAKRKDDAASHVTRQR
ncbi:hypothetical protein XA68_18142 [Ophiocordyceps unilateralis]|uniref:C2H2-type domain-containing protein n=1 Tax=Ophiocordyceps unilateralis TaxID=268505 RepID=A0A2A9PI07_OPHUN|nr:hypothetical protein XA68_18142 [Ophiocordyceps unilateralis]